jgi:tetratricopeptide (TPR) repeat protein
VKSFPQRRAEPNFRTTGRVSWSLWLSGAAQLILAVILAFTPLFDLLGYEFCIALSLLVSITAGPVAIGVVRRRCVAGASGREVVSIEGLLLRALAANLLLLLLPLNVILLNALRIKNCNLLVGLGFFLLLPFATATIFTTWGTTIGVLIRRRFLGYLAYAALWILMAGYNLWEIWSGPQIDSYNQILGWFSGPIYDEVIELGLPLIASRLFGIAWAQAALFALAWLRRPVHDPTARRFYGAWAVMCLIVALSLTFGRFSLGFGRSREQVRHELSAVTATRHFVIHHAPDLSPTAAALTASDHEFRYWQLQRMLGPIDEGGEPLQSYIFSNAEQKRRLVGAGRTQFSKPWQHAIYINGTEFPHPILKHELTHVVASAFGAKPLGISARYGLWINLGLTEGLAEAAQASAEGFDLHTWSAAMRRTNQAPRLIALFTPTGFWSDSGARSYTLAGSFVLFLLTNYGHDRLREAYAAGAIDDVYPKTLSALIADWEKFLDALPLDDRIVEVAKVRFAQPSIFARPCAHEISGIRKEVVDALSAKQFDRARSAATQLLSYLPDDGDTKALMIEIRRRAGEGETALPDGLALLDRSDLNAHQRSDLHNCIGDLLAAAGSVEKAREQYQAMLSTNLNQSYERLALIKLEALERARPGTRVLDFLDSGEADAASVLALYEAALEAKTWASAWYVLGRQLFLRERFAQAIPYLERAGEIGLLHPALRTENLRLLAIARYRVGDRISAALILTVLSQFPSGVGEDLNIHDWFERINFDELHDEGIEK